LITDHLNMSGISPLLGENDDRLGPRFPDMSDVYSLELRAKAHAAAAGVGQVLKEAVYFWWHGPMFETPAEVRMARMLGAGLVGMSTVPEATVARQMGAEVLGLSLCTNRAAGLSSTRLSADEVIEAAKAAASRVRALFDALLPTF
ncbi:MAG: purine-nucleoside phosphorylase, partial [bacterium]